MACDNNYRLAWLVNTLLEKPNQTRKELEDLWLESGLANGKPLARRTFIDHIESVKEVFGYEIKWKTQGKDYRYYIANPDSIRTKDVRYWLLESFSISNMIAVSQNMKGKILYEGAPKGNQYLQTLVKAIQGNRIIHFEYAQYEKDRHSFDVEPYALKLYNHRWYILGRRCDTGQIRSFSLDRVDFMSGIEITEKSFAYPKDFNPEDYYKDVVGIWVEEGAKPQKVRIRVYGMSINYVRSLPIHSSQREGSFKKDEFCEFEYQVCITPELKSQLLMMGNNVEVIEPQSLRDEIHAKLMEACARYEK